MPSFLNIPKYALFPDYPKLWTSFLFTPPFDCSSQLGFMGRYYVMAQENEILLVEVADEVVDVI